MLLIDDRGMIWPDAAGALAGRMHQQPRHWPDPGAQAVALGFILVKFSDAGVSIALRPQLITRQAIAGLADAIVAPEPVRVAISSGSTMPSWEIVVGAGSAVDRIERLVDEARNASPHTRLVDRRLPLERCCDVGRGYLLPFLRIWQDSRGRWDAEFFGRLEGLGLSEMTAVYRRPARSERLIIDNWGSSFSVYGKEWATLARGRDVEDQPDAELGRLHARRLRGEIAEGVPRLASAEVVLRRIDQALMRITFDRLVLPWQTDDGATLVTGARVATSAFVLERPGRRIDTA